MFILLLAATVGAVTMEMLPDCLEYATICDADPVCVALEGATTQCVNEETTKAFAAGATSFTPMNIGEALGACSFMMGKALASTLEITRVPYTLSNLLQCHCENIGETAAEAAAAGTPMLYVELEQPACEWYRVSGVWDALDVCLANQDCIDDWEGVITETKKLDVKWDTTYSEYLTPTGKFDFPLLTQESKNFCLILFGVMAYANADLLNYGASMFAFQVDNGGEIVEECNALMAKRVAGLVGGIAAGVFVLTLIGGCAYTYFCGSKKE